MPHLVIHPTRKLDAAQTQGGGKLPQLCSALAQTLCHAHDEAGKPVFPPGGVRVLAFPSAHRALARRHIGSTLQIDEGVALFDARNSALHPLFQAKA